MRIIVSNSTRGAFRGVLERLKQSLASGGEHIVIVPDRFSASAERAIVSLLGGGATFNVKIMTFTRFAMRTIGDKINRCLTPEGSVMLLAKVIEDNKDALKYYAKGAKVKGFAEEFYAALTALRNSGITPQALLENLEGMTPSLKLKTEDIALIYECYLKELGGAYSDSSTRLEALAAHISASEGLPQHFYVIDFYDFNAPQLEILKGLDIKALSLTVGLAGGYDNLNKRIYTDRVFHKLASLSDMRVIREDAPENLDPVYDTISRCLFSYELVEKRAENNGKVKLRCAKNMRDEVLALALDIVKKIKGGMRYKDIEVLAGDLSAYSREIKSVFARYEIPFFIDGRELLSEQTKVRYILSAIACLRTDLRRTEVLDFVKNPLFYNLLKNGADDVFRFENYLLAFNVNYLPKSKSFTLGEDEDIALAETMRKRVLELLKPLCIFEGGSVKDYTLGARQFLAGCGEEWAKHVGQISEISAFYTKCSEQVDEKIEAVLEEMEAVLVQSCDIIGFENIFTSMLRSLKIALVPTYLDAVFVGDTESRFLGTRDIYVLGANSGKLPSGKGGGAVISGGDEEAFAALGLDITPNRKERVCEELLNITEVMKKPHGSLIISYPETSATGALRPSALISELRNMIDESGKRLPLERIDFDHISRMDAADRKELLEVMLATDKSCYHELLDRGQGYLAAAEENAVYSLAYRFTHEDDRIRLQKLYDIPTKLDNECNGIREKETVFTSVSRLEKYFACPYSHYFSYILNLSKRDEAKFEGTENGTILHGVLAGFYTALRDGKVDPEDISGLSDRLFDETIASDMRLSILMAKAEGERSLKKLKEECARVCSDLYEIYQRSEFKPVYLEAEIGGGEIKPLSFTAGGKKIILRGKIDRVDMLDDNFIVVDYKSSKSTDFSLDMLYYGEKLQLYIYAQALVDSLGAKPAGVFYLPVYANFVKEEEKENRYKFKGQVSADGGIAERIDSLFVSDPKGSILPYKTVSIKRDDGKSQKAMSPDVFVENDKFALLFDYAKRLAGEAVTQLSDGNIAPLPLDKKYCDNCDYIDICAYACVYVRKKGKVNIDSFAIEEGICHSENAEDIELNYAGAEKTFESFDAETANIVVIDKILDEDIKTDQALRSVEAADIVVEEEKPTPSLSEEQQAAVDAKGRVLVAAAAGSGKTRTLIARILKAVGDGVPLSKLLVLVYNVAAAEEIRERLREELLTAARESDGEKRTLYRKEIDNISFARIGTIHSFCQSLIKENFEKAGVSPSFGIIDDAARAVYIKRAMDAVFDVYGTSGDKAFLELTEIFAQGRREDNFRQNILALYETISVQADKDAFSATVNACYFSFENSAFWDVITKNFKGVVSAIKKEIEYILPMVKEHPPFMDKGNKRAELLQVVLGFIDSIKDLDAFKLAKVDHSDIDARFPNAPKNCDSDTKELHERAKQAFYVLKDQFKTLDLIFSDIDFIKSAHQQNAAYAQKLIELAEKFGSEFAALKRADDVMDYSDLEKFALELIADNNYSANFDTVLVDEYQDVNPVQEKIISALIGEASFIVGDVKQSIYGFRKADPSGFIRRADRYNAGEGRFMTFNKNYRSEESILNFVNGIFDSVMTSESSDVDYLKERFFTDSAGVCDNVKVMLFGRSEKSKKEMAQGLYDLSKDVSRLLGTGHDSDDGRDEDAVADDDQFDFGGTNDAEATFIAAEISRLVGRAKIGDRLLGFGDIAVLCRSRKNSDAKRIVQKLKDAGIPVDDKGFGDSSSVPERELMLLLGTLDNPMQDITLAGAMLSYFGGFTESELAELAKSKSRNSSLYIALTDYLNNGNLNNDNQKNDNASAEIAVGEKNKEHMLVHKTRAFLEMLERYRIKASFKNLSELIGGIISDFSYDAYLNALGDGNAMKLASFIEGVGQLKDITLGRFVATYERSDPKAEPKTVGGDRVRISTFHGFKGLEAPMVFVTGAGAKFSAESTKGGLIFDNDGFIALQYFNVDERYRSDNTLSKFAAKLRIKERELKEEMRLFYVALTRAKQYLYVTGSPSKEAAARLGVYPKLDGAELYLDFISQAALEGTLPPLWKWESMEGAGVIKARRQRPLYGAPDDEDIKMLVKAREERYAYKEATSIAMKYSVSALLHTADDASANLFEEKAKEGTAYHRVMENIDFSAEGEDGVRSEIARIVSEGRLTDEQAALVDVKAVSRCLGSDIMREAARSVALRESSFMAYVPADMLPGLPSIDDKVLVQGVIDLIIQGKETVIVDFKNSYLRDEETLEKYKKQLYLYKYAYESSGAAKVDKLVLYSFKTGKALEI